MDESAWEALAARDKVILSGLVDWVELWQVHNYVSREAHGAPLTVIQDATMELIGALVSEGLLVLGEVPGSRKGFVAWETPLEESLRRIHSECVGRLDDEMVWRWFCWLDLTDKGTHMAEAIESAVGARSV